MTRNRYKNRYWTPGTPLTENDRRILAPLLAKARELGRTPTKGEMDTVRELKARFRTWGLAVEAAGLPPLTDPRQVRAREAENRGAG
ncbi:MAG: hypothetical protein LBR00_03360 [Clostridiales Family XIII bacterium]|nr:hypothetical protein [Clostridiales Family XIII bacterium]